jgi:hypothetical protein
MYVKVRQRKTGACMDQGKGGLIPQMMSVPHPSRICERGGQ